MLLGASIQPDHRGEPWFEDGNIVVLTEDIDSDVTVAFKLHRGVLARHSEVFQSMFELPSPDATDVEVAEGCQVVRMHDRPTELSALVRALYDGAIFQHRGIEDFYHVAGILRLSTKYFIAHLRRQAIRHLLETWPHTLRGHDQFIERAVKAPLVGDLTYPYVHPLHVLNLARETHVDIVVPSALYFLSLYNLDDILRGDHPKLLVEHPSRPSGQLSPRDLQDYTLMFQHRITVVLDFIRTNCSARQACPQCTEQKGTCQRAFVRLGTRLSRSWVVRTGPLHYMVQAIDELADDPTICRPCRRAFKHDIMALREKIWSELPGVIGLPSWEELEKMDMA
ncbi:hypothetical protein BD309DRAFT_919814 [Dichomitus squalens]|uniref:BTB domain-containing protein n=1 Tax=Dichomitus squalens TaxID=114155 RepID=A0A4Q9Q4I3_9APHY|nr:uncharacterized protein DICSQDRAFT_145706 [Dichomitus squalens LYAD-421 SS1]EJF63484.1 hypothetical protein DICSQDRAFT_145706 [Dichomitus squalens LYAD-421 SS1]TBU27208.1 hypothetical protein BD311DRAFT_866299 [Dichomitus squalens]TBU44459.1 hypothetical protein BD309DRAFT_919814 [Dichomitus squalens]TBU62232.1 hypothetical protein BD310DRAFT_843831 [Dichomitus squalens]